VTKISDKSDLVQNVMTPISISWTNESYWRGW